jgi:DNA repair exonuclease SbcCD ATPase subunit
MSLTRKSLVAMGIEEEKIEQIIKMHTEVTESLKTSLNEAKADVKKYKADAEKLEEVEKELKTLKENKGEDEYKEKYEKLKADYDKYKGEITAKETKSAKTKALKELLGTLKISDKWYDRIVKSSDLDSMELDENGKFKDADKLTETIKSEWGDCITTTGEKGAKTSTPPASNGGTMTKEDIMKIEDDKARQTAIAENHELFGF